MNAASLGCVPLQRVHVHVRYASIKRWHNILHSEHHLSATYMYMYMCNYVKVPFVFPCTVTLLL